MSLLNAFATAMLPLRLLVAGPLSDALGVQAWYVVGGIFCDAARRRARRPCLV
ncbi:MAG: hypothetical protein ACUVR3_01980 [Candidatus Roseilinea sp.]